MKVITGTSRPVLPSSVSGACTAMLPRDRGGVGTENLPSREDRRGGEPGTLP